METQITNINPQPKQSWLDTAPKLLTIGVPLVGAIAFTVIFWATTTGTTNDVEQLKKEMKEKVDKHDFEDLDEKVTRQWTNQNDNNNRLRAEFNPVRDWMYTEIGKELGYEQARKELKK